MNKRILICDDDQGILEMLTLVLEGPDVEVVTEADSLKLNAMIRKTTPDLLILDIWMPVLSGDQILAKLRNDPEFGSLKVIMMSASRDGEHIATKVGANAYLAKPFDIAQLYDLVEEYLPD